jgi:hypothetical protein
MHYFLCPEGLVRIPQIAHRDVTPNLCFCIHWDLWVTFWIPVHPGCETSMHYILCSGGTDTDSTKGVSGQVAPSLFLHPVGFAGHAILVCPGPETSTHYFSCSGGTGTYSTKSVVGHVTANLCFCIRWDLQVMQCIPVHPGHETSSRTSMYYTKNMMGHITPKLCFCIRWDMQVTFCIPVCLGRETTTHYF